MTNMNNVYESIKWIIKEENTCWCKCSSDMDTLNILNVDDKDDTNMQLSQYLDFCL